MQRVKLAQVQVQVQVQIQEQIQVQVQVQIQEQIQVQVQGQVKLQIQEQIQVQVQASILKYQCVETYLSPKETCMFVLLTRPISREEPLHCTSRHRFHSA